MKITPLAIPDVLLIEPKRFGDARGFFSETYSRRALREAGIDLEFVQDNHSLSCPAGTVRGLHFQAPPHAQAKLVRVTRGCVLDVAVDIRVGSPTFGQHVSAELSADNWLAVLVPAGFAHGFVTLEPDTEVCYKVTDYYAPQCDGGIAWDDPALGIDWMLERAGCGLQGATLSEKDRKHPTLAAYKSPFVFAAKGGA